MRVYQFVLNLWRKYFNSKYVKPTPSNDHKGHFDIDGVSYEKELGVVVGSSRNPSLVSKK